VDLNGLDALVLSHGHHDHGNGVRRFLGAVPFTGPLWTGPGFFDRKWSLDADGPRYAGVDFGPDHLASLGVEWVELSGRPGETAVREVVPGIFAVNGFPRRRAAEPTNPRFAVDRGGSRQIDDFREETCLAVAVAGGLAVVLGCSHPGIMNMLEAVRAALGLPVRAVLGGSHLVEAGLERAETVADYLGAAGCSLAALGHCTGDAASAVLASRLPAYRPLSVGAEFLFDDE
jgi:7,8-dihydropterin-6-yl-methyl-4-(beta-D-ribofuranosyl)aminobenzene 5'-phosphate synthase